MNKIPCASQNTDAVTLSADCRIVRGFGRDSPAAVHSVDCRYHVVVDLSFFHYYMPLQRVLPTLLKQLQIAPL